MLNSKLVLVTLAALATGTLVGSIPFVRDAQGAPRAPTYTYLCFGASNADEVQMKANAAGKEGWELGTASYAPDGTAIWCFKKPAR
jgi:hypothetical protein